MEASTVKELMPTLTEAIEVWIKEGIEPVMNRFNRRGQVET
jgi:hypothetical protein